MSEAVIAMRSVPCACALPTMKTAASKPQNARFMIKTLEVRRFEASTSQLACQPLPSCRGLLKRRAWRRPSSRCKTSTSPSAARRCSTAPSSSSASASASAWSAATARASRPAQDRGRDWSRRMAARASRSRARRSATCRRSRTSPALPRRSPMSRRASRPATIRTARAICCEQLGLTGDEDARAALGRRGAARGARARARARARHPAARRADQPSRPAGDRVARRRARGLALGAGADQPRPAVPGRRCRARPSGSTAA